MKIKVKNSGIIRLNRIIDEDGDGDIFVAEAAKHIPFKIKRVFFITAPKRKGSIRGQHSLKKTSRVIFCINGSFVLNLDDGEAQQSIRLADPAIGVLLGPNLWHTMSNISETCCMLVLADDFYREKDYIRDYQEFLKYTSQKQ